MKKVVLITGVSSGFGLETARLLASEGHVVYGTVRREVEPIAGVSYIRADVTSDADAEAAVAEVVRREGRLDVLVCNAGMGIGGPIEFSAADEIRLQMDTNFGGQVRFIQAALPVMRARKSGTIVCMSSIGGLMGLPFQGFYSASKFAVEGFCEALRMEVRKYGIDVVVINPGDFATGFTAKRRKAISPEAEKAYPTYAASMQSIEKDENGGLKPIKVAQTIARLIRLKRPARRYIVASPLQRLSVTLKKILPPRLFSMMLGSYYKL